MAPYRDWPDNEPRPQISWQGVVASVVFGLIVWGGYWLLQWLTN